jgi:group II intron reverse transcriptase/maturase
MHGRRKSHSPIRAEKPPNNAEAPARSAEAAEQRGLAERNPGEQTRLRTQGRDRLTHALHRIRQAARRDPDARLTALWHHVYAVDTLREAFYGLNRKASPGTDDVTWSAYATALEANLQDLSARLKRGAYRAPPVVRAYIAKADGGQRPLGKPTLEDKIVQSATVMVLNMVYETHFLGFSYGFRPGRHPHRALDALYVGLVARKINWVYDADIQGFFDAIDHEWLIRFVAHRIGDQRVIRHIKKWLHAGVLEDGQWRQAAEGTPQGGCISPLLANIYLHYALDQWAHWWRQRQAQGDVIIVRYADDFVVGFQFQTEAQRFHQELTRRFRRFGLTLHPTKTRLLEFGRFAVQNRRDRGAGKPETFDFLGFTHICRQTPTGRFTIRRQTVAKRLQRKLADIARQLRARRHWRLPAVGRWLGSVVRGHFRYYGVPGNFALLKAFRQAVIRLWQLAIRARSQRPRATWARLYRLARRWLPYPRIQHPYPSARLRV